MVREIEYFITPALIVFNLKNFEDTKGVVRIHKSKKDRQDKTTTVFPRSIAPVLSPNSPIAKRKETKRQTTIYKTLHRKLNIEE